MAWRLGLRPSLAVQEKPAFPDWTDAAAYAALQRADRSLFAWEWLRRRTDYREAADLWFGARPRRADLAQADPAAWGLHRFERPDRAVPDARPLWQAHVHPLVLQGEAIACAGPGKRFGASHLRSLTTVERKGGREHLLLSDGFRMVRLDILRGSLLEGTVRILFALDERAVAERRALALRRLLALWRSGRFSRALHPVAPRARRDILLLRAHDAVASGATHREIAAVLLNKEVLEGRWRVNAASLRSRAQRLASGARRLVGGEYRQLLR